MLGIFIGKETIEKSFNKGFVNPIKVAESDKEYSL